MGTAIILSDTNQRDKVKGCSRSGAGKGLTMAQAGCQETLSLEKFLLQTISQVPGLGVTPSG